MKKKEESAYATLIGIMMKNATIPNQEKARQLTIILSFMQKISGISIETLETFNKASEQNPDLVENLKKIIQQGERSRYPVRK